MALLDINFYSQELCRSVHLLAIVPSDRRRIDGKVPFDKKTEKPFRTLYLLHGIHGCEIDWLTGTRIQRWAQERDLAVVFPAGENKFYNDVYPTHDFFEKYIGQEVVEFTRNLLPLSDRREDTCIGGLSMGGYGALCAGLRYPETFGSIIALSAATLLQYPKDDNTIDVVGRRSQLVACMGPEEEVEESGNNPFHLAESWDKPDELRPKIFQAVGTEDFLLKDNRTMRDALRKNGFDVSYLEEHGGHEWDFWDRNILRALDWFAGGKA